MKYGYLYQGQWYRWQKQRRGTPTLGLPRPAMINFIQNHDQVANSARGQRVQRVRLAWHAEGDNRHHAFVARNTDAFSGPGVRSFDAVPVLRRPQAGTRQLIRKGRSEFLEQWRALRLPEMRACFDDPSAPATFSKSRSLIFRGEEARGDIRAAPRSVALAARRSGHFASRRATASMEQCCLDDALSFGFSRRIIEDDRLLVVNLGVDLELNPAPEPLLAPPESKAWEKAVVFR